MQKTEDQTDLPAGPPPRPRPARFLCIDKVQIITPPYCKAPRVSGGALAVTSQPSCPPPQVGIVWCPGRTVKVAGKGLMSVERGHQEGVTARPGLMSTPSPAPNQKVKFR